jgi:hypothetical protein
MPVNSSCAEYTDRLAQWKLVRDLIAGEASIKAAGEDYLPKPSGQTDQDYRRYLQRTHLFGALGRTAEGLHGNIFDKDPVQGGDTTEDFRAMLKNIDGSGTSIDQFASDISWDAMQTGSGGILADYPQTPEGISQAEAKKQGYGAYLSWYDAESIINWRYEARNDKSTLVLAVLKEPYEKPAANDEFLVENKNKYRVLLLTLEGEYIQRIYDEAVGLENYKTIDTIKIDGKPLDFIPFFPCPGKKPEKSMLLDLAFENIGHYQKTADYENGLHWTGVPTPAVENMKAPEDEKGNKIPVRLGGASCLFLNEPGADVRAHFLEFTGAGLGELLKALSACEERMAILGARIISAEKKGVETAEAAKIHRAGENGVLGAFARNMSERITQAVILMARWNGHGEVDFAYSLNTDYDALQASAQLISTILAGRMNGELPRMAVFRVAKKAELINEDMNYEEFLEALEQDHTGPHGPDGEAA